MTSRRYAPVLLLLSLALAAMPSTGQARSSSDQMAVEPTIVDPIIVESFDGEPIVATLMLPAGASAEKPVPAILRTHGWGGERERTPSGIVSRLLEEGYAVLTWDSRGFGDSGGEANVGSPNFEVKDARIVKSGHRLELEITTGSGQYQIPQGAYTVKLRAITKLPLTRASLVEASRRALR